MREGKGYWSCASFPRTGKQRLCSNTPLLNSNLLYFRDEYPWNTKEKNKTKTTPFPQHFIFSQCLSHCDFICCFVIKNYTGLQQKTPESVCVSFALVQSKLLLLLISAVVFICTHETERSHDLKSATVKRKAVLQVWIQKTISTDASIIL